MKKLFLAFFLLAMAFFASAQYTCSDNTQCNDLDDATLDLCVRPGQSDSGCTNLNCTPVCLYDDDCDDNDSATLDVCAGAGRCTAECVHLSLCGNGVVDSGETPCTCPQDAGACTGSSLGTCSEFACIGTECRETVKLGCCENNICEFGENYSSCSLDCKPKNIEIEIIGITEETFFVRGEEALVKVKLSADGTPIKNAFVDISGFFGETKLLNDGRHGDELNDDEYYANYVSVPNDLQADEYTVTVNTLFDGQRGIKDFRFVVAPVLDIRLETDNEEYALGSQINVSGVILRKNTAIKTAASIVVYSNGIKTLEKEVQANELGEFEFSYRTSFLENAGNWSVEVFASDEFGNNGYSKKDFIVSDSSITSYLTIQLLQEIGESFNRGEKVFLSVKVVKGISDPVSSAQVTAIAPDNSFVELLDKGGGVYEGELLVGLGFPLGEQEVSINALKKEDEKGFFAGTQNVSFTVKKVDLEVEIVEPTRFSFQVGEEIEFVARIFYPDKKPVVAPVIISTVNKKPVFLEQVTKGTYTGKYLVEEEDAPLISFEMVADDGFENKGSHEIEFEVSGVSVFHYLRKHFASVALLAFAACLLAVIIMIKLVRAKNLSEIQKRQKIIFGKIKNIQEQYFKEGTLDKKNYDLMMEKLLSELEYLKKSAEAENKKNLQG